MTPPAATTLRQYTDLFVKCKRKIQCPVCQQILPIQHWTKHPCCRRKRNSCPWCFGRLTFKHGEKAQHLPHLVQCFHAFEERNAPERIQTAETDPPASSSSTTASHDDDVCLDCLQVFDSPPAPRHQLLGRPRLQRAVPDFYRCHHDQPPDWLDLPRDNLPKELALVLNNGHVLGEHTLGLDPHVHHWIKRFYAFRNVYRWYHLMVRAEAYPTFLQALERHSDQVCLLPFWCLCDGQSEHLRKLKRGPLYVHHRHVLLVTRMSGTLFENKIWRRVTGPSDDDPEQGGFLFEPDEPSHPPGPPKKFKLKIPIQNILHFCNALCYVSSTKSKCKGAEEKEDEEEDDSHPEELPQKKDDPLSRPNQPNLDHRHHYFLYHPIHTHNAVHTLAHLFPEGQDLFLTQCIGPRKRGLYAVARPRYDANKNCKFFIRPTDACPHRRKCTLALARHFQLAPPERDIPLDDALKTDPSELPTHYLFAGSNSGKKNNQRLLPLQRNDALTRLSARAWIRHQVRRGPILERTKDDWLALGRNQQDFLNDSHRNHKDLHDQIETLNRQLQQERRLCLEKDQQLQIKDDQIKTQENQIKAQEDQIKDQHKQLKEKDRQLEKQGQKFRKLSGKL